MTERSLQVTYRKGRAFAAYLHFSYPTGADEGVLGDRLVLDERVSQGTGGILNLRVAARTKHRIAIGPRVVGSPEVAGAPNRYQIED
jgi:hypothetical protein